MPMPSPSPSCCRSLQAELHRSSPPPKLSNLAGDPPRTTVAIKSSFSTEPPLPEPSADRHHDWDFKLAVISITSAVHSLDRIARFLNQFYKNCRISGTIDFIFGNSSSIFQDCSILMVPQLGSPEKRETNAVTAQGRTDPSEPTRFVFLGCIVNGTDDYTALYKASPELSRQVMEGVCMNSVHPMSFGRDREAGGMITEFVLKLVLFKRMMMMLIILMLIDADDDNIDAD